MIPSWVIATIIWVVSLIVTMVIYNLFRYKPVTSKEDAENIIGAFFMIFEAAGCIIGDLLCLGVLVLETFIYLGWWIYHLATT